MKTTAAPLYQQIQEFVRQGIRQGRFKAGDRLPSEPELAQRFDTTRATVARAFQQLVFENLISRRSGSGSFVSTRTFEDRVDTARLESFEDHVLAAGESLQYRLLVFAPCDTSAEVAQSLALKAPARSYRLERLRIVNDRVAALEQRHLPETIARGIHSEWLADQTIQNVLTQRLGLQIGRMENAISAAIASAAIAKLLEARKGSALLVREHTIFDPRGRVLLHGRTLYPDDFRVRYTLRSPAA